ncbi:ribonuclease H-like domain-containing protein [Tanacetum coccineum]
MSQPANDDFSQHLSDDEASYHEDASENGTATNKPKQQQQQLIPTTTTISNIKLPILKKEEYDIWAMEMEHYLEYIDNDVWKVIQNGNSKKRISTGKDGVVRILPPVSAAETHAIEKERKARTILLMAIPKEHLRRFHGMDDAKEIWEAIRTRFGGNANSKKMQKVVLKQQFEAFTISSSEGLEKRYDRFQQLLSQLEAHGVEVSTEDANHKFLRSLPLAWSNLAMTMRTNPDVDTLSIDDFKSSTNKVKSSHTGAYSTCTPTSSNNIQEREVPIDDIDIEEMDINWQIAMIAIRIKKFYKRTGRRVRIDGNKPGINDGKKRDSFYQDQGARKKEQNQNCLLTMDDGVVNWGEHTLEEEETNHALMAISSNNEVSLCSKTCIDSYNKLKTLCDDQMNQLGEQEAKILAYTLAVKKLEAQVVTFQKQQLSLNEQLTFQANEIYAKDEKLKKYRRIGMKAIKEKEQLQKTVDSWKNSSKNLWKLVDSGMTSNSKVGLGYEIQSNNEVLSYEEEMNRTVFKCTEEDFLNKPLYSRFSKTNNFKGVPHPLYGDYTPKPQEEIDDSLYVYGKKGPQKPKISDSDDNSTEHSTCQSNDSEGSFGNPSEHSSKSESKSISVPNEMYTSKSVTTNEKVVSESKVVEPSCAHHKMAREAELKKQRIFTTGNGVAKSIWKYANRVNRANHFIHRPVQLNTVRQNVNSVRPNVNTGRANVNTVRANVNSVRQNVNSVRTNINTVRSKQPVPPNNTKFFSPVRPQEIGALLLRPQQDHPLKNMEDRGIFDSGCSGHMTGNKDHMDDSDDNSIEHSTCQSNDSEGSFRNPSKHSSESESRSISVPNEMSTSKSVTANEKFVSESKEVEPSCVTHVKTPRKQMKNQETHEVKGKNWNEMMERKLEEGYSFIKKKCFVCGSLSHLIKDCDYYEKKMTREAEFKKQRVFNTGNKVAKPVWTNANRVNHAHQFVPRSIQLNAGRPNINSVRPNINTGRTNVNSVRPRVNTGSSNVNTVRSRQPVPTRTSNSFSPVRPQVNKFNQRSHFSKSHSPVRRPIVRNTARMTYSHAVKGNWGTAVKTSAGYNWRRPRPNSNYNSGSNFIRTDHPLKNMEDRGIFDSGCSGHMTGNKDHLDDFEECKGGSVTFGGSKGYITGKGRIKVGHINFKNLNKLVKGNLVRGLPSFQKCPYSVPATKVKQHKGAPVEAKLERQSLAITTPCIGYLFGPTSVKSINHASYCLVITDDCTRFSWVFFLATKDETSGILQNFIRQIENQLNHRVKIIRSDNGTEFKNRDMLEFCGNKGIKQEYSNARTPQQNGVAERMNRTLIEAARTMLADHSNQHLLWQKQ